MKYLLICLLFLSASLNIYLGLTLARKSSANQAGVINEMVFEFGIQDLSYFLRNSGITKERIFQLSKIQPTEKGSERQEPQLEDKRFLRYPVEIIFSESGKIDRIKVVDKMY